MYPDQFEYQRPSSVSEAVEMLSNHPDAELIAGGHSLLPTMKSGTASPGTLVDIGNIGRLDGIEHSDSETRIGAMTRYADVVADDRLWDELPVIAETVEAIGDVQVRNRGTVGGNIAHADPTSDLPAAVLAADATVTVEGPDSQREVRAEEFFQGMFATAAGEGEVVTELVVPHHWSTGAYAKKVNPASGYALVGVAVALTVDDGTVETARVAANGVMDHAVRLSAVEEQLQDEPLNEETPEAAKRVAGDSLDESMIMEDQQASAEFRLQLLGVYTQRALDRASSRQ